MKKFLILVILALSFSSVSQANAELDRLKTLMNEYSLVDHKAYLDDLKNKAKHGDKDAQFKLGSFYSEVVKTYYLSANMMLDPNADYDYISNWFNNNGLDNRTIQIINDNAKKWFTASAEAGSEGAQLELLVMYFNSPEFKRYFYRFLDSKSNLYKSDEKDFKNALKSINKLVEKGNAGGQFYLGALLIQDNPIIGLEKDINEGIKYLELADAQGIFTAKFALLSVYLSESKHEGDIYHKKAQKLKESIEEYCQINEDKLC